MRRFGRLAVAAMASFGGICLGVSGSSAAMQPVPGASPVAAPVVGAAVGADVEQALAASPTVHVVVLLEIDPALATRRDRQPLRREVARQQDRILAALRPGDMVLRSRPRHAPILAGEIGRAGLERLRRLSGVRRIDLDRPGSGGLAQSVPLVRADMARALGYNGAGMVVGEVDSGVDTDHADLVGAVVAQACTCVTNGGCCPNGGIFQVGPGAAEDDAGHGTLVAGVMTSDGILAPIGVAPAAKIVVVKVTDATDHTCCMSDVTSALDWILDNRPDVAAINCSVVSNALYPGDCDNADAVTGGMAFVINALRAAGIPMFAAAGNAGTGGGMSAPACVSGAVSLGATYDADIGPVTFGVCSNPATAADQVACFTNSDASTDLFAPGGAITTSALGGGVAGSVFGTSFSAPHATACAALLKQADPSISAGAIEISLKATGHPVTDPKNNLTFPRIDCLAAIQVRSCPDGDDDDYWVAGPGCPGPPFSDCDDADASRYPGAAELCDQKDNDCDGTVDEGFDPDGDDRAACVDNCPVDWNPAQEDRDQDTQGDACDLDDGVIEVWLTTANQVRWQQEAGFDRYDLYRSDLGALDDTDGDGAAQDYGSCFAENLTGPTFTDADRPAVGHGFIYLVTGRTAAGEGDLGTASSGAPRPNVRNCSDVFGTPPVIQGMSATTAERQVSCDVTTSLLGRICTFGVPGAQASAPIVVEGGYTEARIESQVTDADITGVTASLLPASGGNLDVDLFDDGSAAVFPVPQRSADYGLDCTLDPQTCSCTSMTFGVESGDTTGADTAFTRTIALVASSLPAIVQDCVMQERRQLPVVVGAGVPVTIEVTARDAAGHVTAWPASPTVAPGSGSYACTGDLCGCCFLTSTDPVAQCSGLPGLVAPDFPSGLCTSF